MLFLCIAPPPIIFNLNSTEGVNLGDERGQIGNENGVLGFGIELAGCLMRERRRENKGGTQMTIATFVILCN